MTGRELKQNTEAIRDMIDCHLKSVSETSVMPEGSHLDEDTIAAFVEGRLQSSESAPVLAHLVACAPCRRSSAQVIRLEDEVAATDEQSIAPEGPGRLQNFLDSLASHIAPATNEDVVFAYQNPPDQAEGESAKKPENDSDENSD